MIIPITSLTTSIDIKPNETTTATSRSVQPNKHPSSTNHTHQTAHAAIAATHHLLHCGTFAGRATHRRKTQSHVKSKGPAQAHRTSTTKPPVLLPNEHEEQATQQSKLKSHLPLTEPPRRASTYHEWTLRLTYSVILWAVRHQSNGI